MFTLALLVALPLVAGASCTGSQAPKNTQKAEDYSLLSVTYEVVAQQVEEIVKKLEKYDPTAFVEEIHGGMSVPNIKSARTLQVTKNGKVMEILHHTAILYEKTTK